MDTAAAPTTVVKSPTLRAVGGNRVDGDSASVLFRRVHDYVVRRAKQKVKQKNT